MDVHSGAMGPPPSTLLSFLRASQCSLQVADDPLHVELSIAQPLPRPLPLLPTHCTASPLQLLHQPPHCWSLPTPQMPQTPLDGSAHSLPPSLDLLLPHPPAECEDSAHPLPLRVPCEGVDGSLQVQLQYLRLVGRVEQSLVAQLEGGEGEGGGGRGGGGGGGRRGRTEWPRRATGPERRRSEPSVRE